MILKYADAPQYYGLYWDYDNYQLRGIRNDELDIFLRYTLHDHVNDILKGNEKGYFSNIFLRPIMVKPHSETVIYSVVCHGDTYHEVLEALR